MTFDIFINKMIKLLLYYRLYYNKATAKNF